MKIKELRLLNITIKKDEQILYQGKTEDIPQNLKEETYKNIFFEGVDVVVELWFLINYAKNIREIFHIGIFKKTTKRLFDWIKK